ncbi:MAG: aromatic amino acid hydroxylase [Pseudomonadota bacterium]|nr:aromatic amino acid hydroxylase [Pseudomonadota bacterium]
MPSYLKRYCAVQAYDSYTAQDHAVWRHALQQLTSYLAEHAVAIYPRGLVATGITLEKIPRIEDIDACMGKFGWGAVAVEGFIPPKTFLEFQALRVLPIAADIRRFAHLTYTPAPDIIHEAAGHAPIIADETYAEYLTRYAELAQKAIFSSADIRLYEAIRYLSDIKEMRGVSTEDIAIAQQRLDAVVTTKTEASEAARVARLYWWTAEYGLVGDLNNPKIYGAGLLSSVLECRTSLAPTTKKLPLSLQALDTAYDITEPQPQLFVAQDFAHLHATLATVETTMSFRNGGEEGLRRAKIAATVNTCELDSGLQVSAQITDYEQSDGSWLVNFAGACQFAWRGQELIGHGCRQHPDGYMLLIGKLKDTPKCSWQLTADDLAQLGLHVGAWAEISLAGGYQVHGVLVRWYRHDGRLLYLTWADGKITKDAKLIQPFKQYDMVLGTQVTSVFGGPAAREEFGEYPIGEASTKPRGAVAYTDKEKSLYDLYARVAAWRASQYSPQPQEFTELIATIERQFSDQWLLAAELLELVAPTTSSTIVGALRKIANAG